MGIDHRRDLQAIMQAALEAVDPRRLAGEALAGQAPGAGEHVLAVGKAAPKMLAGFVDAAGDPAGMLLVVPEGVEAPGHAMMADHPVPTERNIEASERVLEFVSGAADGAGFAVLLSGGASALLTLPAPPLGLDDVQRVTRALLASGADIRQINCIRKHIERLKGGRLAALMAPLPVRALVLSDVIGDDPASIGSGPVSPDPTTFAEAIEVVERFAPGATAILEFLHRAEARGFPETPKPGDAIFARVDYRIIGNNERALAGARAAAEALGFSAAHAEARVTGEAADVGRRLAHLALDLRNRGGGPWCVLLGGETTVSVGNARGKGGRNQELALAAAIEIDGADGISIATLATDGVDGPTDAAGAIATGATCAAARAANLQPTEYLQTHDSHTLFGRVDALIRTGPTGTNVNDLAIALIS